MSGGCRHLSFFIFQVTVQSVVALLTHSDIDKQLLVGNGTVEVTTCSTKYTTTAPAQRLKLVGGGGVYCTVSVAASCY